MMADTRHIAEKKRVDTGRMRSFKTLRLLQLPFCFGNCHVSLILFGWQSIFLYCDRFGVVTSIFNEACN